MKKIVFQLERLNSKAHVLFASSTREEGDGLYGASKKEGRRIFSDWAEKFRGKFTGFVIPNVFGSFGKPFHNSFIATFCQQLCNGITPLIDSDSFVKLIYVDDLVKIFVNEILNGKGNKFHEIEPTDEFTVSEILEKFNVFRSLYLVNGIIPKLESTFELNLFNTFRSYIDVRNYFPVKFVKHSDSRGSFVELMRVESGGQISFSITLPGITRGNHFHTRKIERFAVIKGKALIQLRKIGSDEVHDFYLDGEEAAYVDMPVWYTHNITNIGDGELYTVFWNSDSFEPSNPDTFLETVKFNN